MAGIKFLKRIASIIGIDSNDVFKFTYTEQKYFIESFTEPRDDIERSYNQYCCQMKLRGRLTEFFLNLASLPLIFYYFFKKNDTLEIDKKCDATYITEGILSRSLLPNSLIGKYHVLRDIKVLKECFTSSDKLFFKKTVCRYPFSWHFLFKILVKIRVYSFLLQNYEPKAIITCNEYSFTSSALTCYCNENHVKHINVMHGEKLYFLRDTFFHYDVCYIWSAFYQTLFTKLRAEKTQFRVFTPPSLVLGDGKQSKKEFDYTYYLGGEKDITIDKIISTLQKLAHKGNKVAIRPHPIYTDLNELKKYCYKENNIAIENKDEIDIAKSVLRTKHAISLYSTVLNQAYHSGVDIVIDDVTNLEKYLKLKEYHYIMLNVKHTLLSDLIK